MSSKLSFLTHFCHLVVNGRTGRFVVNIGVQQALGTKESIVTLRTSRTSSTVGFNQDYLSGSIITLSSITSC